MVDKSQLVAAISQVAKLIVTIPFTTAESSRRREDRKTLMDALSKLLRIALPNARYAAFHYRSSVLPEGRYSPFTYNDSTRKAVIQWVNKPEGIDEDGWTKIFLDSLLQTYLYVFGRDVSFSENCILIAESHARQVATRLETSSEVLNPVTLRIPLTANSENKQEEGTSMTDYAINLNHEMFTLFTVLGTDYSDSLVGEVWKAVSQGILEKKDEKQCNWDNAVLNKNADFRRVFHNTEQADPQASRYSQQHTFTELQKRGLELSHYTLGRSGGNSDLAELIKDIVSLKVFPENMDRDNAWAVLRVLQAACVFTPLLGEMFTVHPFITYRGVNPEAIRNLLRHLAGDAPWEEKEEEMRKRPMKWPLFISESPADSLEAYGDACSGLTIYAEEGSSIEDAQIKDVILSLQVLSAGISLCLCDVVREPCPPAELCQQEEENRIQNLQLDEKTISWSRLGYFTAEALRGVTHEAKRLGFNIAIGTELEFREVLTHIYCVRRKNESSNEDSVRQFQTGLRTFIRRNFSFLDFPYRFICINKGPGAELMPYSISDLKPSFHRKTTSETARTVVSRSGLTYVRVDPSGRAYILSKDLSGTAVAVYRCDPSGRWKEFSQNIHGFGDAMLLKDVEELIKNKDQSWDRFVSETLIPTIEVVSEDPSSGAAIVVLDSLTAIQNRYFELPEGNIELSSAPENDWRFVGRETFKSMIIQDGATIIERQSHTIWPRMQLIGAMGESEFKIWLESIDPYTKLRASEWGTRHISALHFVASVSEDKIGMDISVLVISQDGDVHLMRNMAPEWCKRIVPN